MGLLSTCLQFGRWLHGNPQRRDRHDQAHSLRVCRVEKLEPRRLMAADLHLGAVYYEDDAGNDTSLGDTIQVTYEGGQAGTKLTHLVIDGDKDLDGRSAGDAFFDTVQHPSSDGNGVLGAAPLTIVSHAGFTISNFTVSDGGTRIEFDAIDWDPGEKLVFQIDVDEQQGKVLQNAIVEGAEFEGSHLIGTFQAPHYFDVTGDGIFYDEFDSTFAQSEQQAGSHLNLPNDSYIPPSTTSQVDRTAGAVVNLVQTPKPITLGGRVFVSNDLDLVQDSGEASIPGVTLSLLKWNGSQYVSTGLTQTTNASGDYKFEGLLPGQYRVVETQPSGYFSVGDVPGTVDGSTRGVTAGPDVLTDISLEGGEDSIHNNFAEADPAQLCGNVYHDRNNNGILEAGEEPIAGVQLMVIPISTIAPGQGTVVVTTAADGSYCATGLIPGEYKVVEIHPAGWIDGKDTPGDAGGTALNPGDQITGAHLIGGQHGENYNFGELKPNKISGRVIADYDDDCEYTPGIDQPIEGVTMQLLDHHGNVIATTLTNAQGEYEFNGLPGGTYQVREVQPAGYLDADDHVGTAGGQIVANDQLGGIILVSDTNGEHYDFCEIVPVSIAGHVHADPEGDCIIGPNDIMLEGVTIQLFDAAGVLVATTTTDHHGEYSFSELPPGVYTVHEVQPAGYFQGDAMEGSAGGIVSGDTISQVSLPPGTNATEYNFCELLPSSISGHVHADPEGDCLIGPNDIMLEGVTIQLFDAAGVLVATTTTDHHGEYSFTLLPPGVYTVHEVQPAGYFQGDAMEGSVGGMVNGDTISQIDLPASTNAVEYNFCELLPASISGTVHADPEDDCLIGPNDIMLQGVTIQLLDTAGNVVATTQTDENGYYEFTGLEPGTYGVREIQPGGYIDHEAEAGTAGGTVVDSNLITDVSLGSDQRAFNYDFCEGLPASISGRVHADTNGDCEYQEGEPLLEGVEMQLLNAEGQIIAITYTDANGEYRFDGLEAGTYSVREIQPSGYFDDEEHVGTAGGVQTINDQLDEIVLTGGVNGEHYDFCETPPVQLSGYVFQDGPTIVVPYGQPDPDIYSIRDGVKDATDTPIPGVLMTLADASGLPVLDDAGHPITTHTDANGYYEFTGLAPGLYTVVEGHPAGYEDWLETAGSTGGFAVNPNGVSTAFILSTLAVDPHFDAIVRIPVPAGFNSINNDFSEVKIVHGPPPPPPPENPPELPIYQLPGIPPLPPLPPEPLPPQFAYIPEGYAAHGAAWTWHLSVVNAGQPRSLLEADESLVRLTNSRFDVLAWNNMNMGQATWILNDGKIQTPVEHIFGDPRAIPVTGDFNGDGVTDIGVYIDGEWFIDLNGNGVWDAGDLYAQLGSVADKPVVGDWDGDGKADIGIFGPEWGGDRRQLAHEPGLPDPHNAPNGKMKNMPPLPEHATDGVRALKLTADGKVRADLIDHVFEYGAPGDKPVAGDWDGTGITRIGVFRQGTWYLDMNGNGKFDTGDVVAQFGVKGDLPVVGDWNGDGITKIGIFHKGHWTLDTNNNRRIDALDKVFELGGPDDVPVVGDWTGSGKSDVGLYRKGVIEHKVYVKDN